MNDSKYEPIILVVDDEAIVAKNLQRILNKLGYRVPEIAFSGEDAVTIADTIQPDLILMDINMPGELDGIEAANLIRPRLDTPIIFVTAHADEEIISRAKISEPFGYILKPVTVRELQSNIEMALYKHQLEKELKENRAYWQALTENASDIVLLIESDGRVKYVSPSANQIIGFSADELMGLDLVARIHDDDYVQIVEDFKNVAQLPHSIHTIMFRFLHKNDQWIYLEGLVRNKLNDPKIDGYVINIRDVTERIAMETELLQSNQRLGETLAHLKATQNQLVERERLAAVGQLSGGIAHEFNNIMAAVILQSDLLLNRGTLNNDVFQKVKLIRDCGERAADLVQQILDFSRRAMLQIEPVDIGQFLKDLKLIFNHLLGEKVNLNLIVEAKPLMVRVDSGRLKQALVNLILNSHHAMPEGGRFRVEATQQVFTPDDSTPLSEMGSGRWVRLIFEDTGRGIESDVLPHVFEPFFSTDTPLKSGLGLSQTLGIVQQHQGHLTIESTVGVGTKVTIYLPFHDTPLTDSSPRQTIDRDTSGRILLFETNEQLRYALADGLVTLGYDVLVAGNIEDATAYLEQFGRQILCLICDENNEGASANNFGRKAMIVYPQMNVILLADYVSLDDDVDELGIVWLRKPVSLELLENAISRIMTHRAS